MKSERVDRPPRASHPILRLEGVGKRYFLSTDHGHETFLDAARRLATGQSRQIPLWALRDLSFELRQGDILGVIGPNGAGKSTLLLLLSGILKPTEGRLRVGGETSQFFHLSSGLQPRLTVLENFQLCAALLGMPKKTFSDRFPTMLGFSGLQPYLHAKYGELSTGLAARLPFSTVLHTDCDILLVDEMLAVGDAAFQEKCVQAFMELRKQGRTMVIVSHAMDLIVKMCTRVLLLREGRMATLGDVREVIDQYVRTSVPAPAPSADTPPPWLSDQRLKVLKARWESELKARLDEEWTKKLEVERSAAAERYKELEARVKGRSEAKRSPTLTEKPASQEERPWREHDILTERMSTKLGVNPESIYLFNGTGLRLFLRWALLSGAMGNALRPGDEVIAPIVLPEALFDALDCARLVPAMVDLAPDGGATDLSSLDRIVSSRTRALILRHNLGIPSDLDLAGRFCQDHGLLLIELLGGFAAHRWRGKPVGTWGDIGIYTRDNMAAVVLGRRLAESSIINREYGCPAAMSAIQAAAVAGHLASLDADKALRIEAFSRIHALILAREDLFFPAGYPPHADINPEFYPIVFRPEARVGLTQLLDYFIENGSDAWPVTSRLSAQTPLPRKDTDASSATWLRAGFIPLTRKSGQQTRPPDLVLRQFLQCHPR